MLLGEKNGNMHKKLKYKIKMKLSLQKQSLQCDVHVLVSLRWSFEVKMANKHLKMAVEMKTTMAAKRCDVLTVNVMKWYFKK